MTVVLPPPVDLPMPRGDVEQLRELVRDVGGAAFWLAALGERLAGPAASAPGWLGADATAAAEQVVRVSALTRDAGDAVQRAAGRLSAHADLLADVRRQVAGLRAEQDDDVRSASRRLGHYVDFQPLATTDSPAAYAIVADFEAAERSRSRRCDALAEEVEEDAAATGRVLADACAVVGGQGARGDAARVVAYLAAEMPGWGDLELARRARAAADRFFSSGMTSDEMEEVAAGALPYAAMPAFADALLADLGAEKTRLLLYVLGSGTLDPDGDVARLLAGTFGAAGAGASGEGPVTAVLTATYLRADEPAGDSGGVASGMATVLAAGRSIPSGGLPTATVGEWARQLLLWEQAQHQAAGAFHNGWPVGLQDPSALALTVLAERADPGASARLLGDARVWEAALARTWPDAGAALALVVAQAGQETGVLGASAVRTGLVVTGAGLVEGDPSDRTVDQGTVDAVSLALGLGVAAHVAIAANPLAASADGKLPVFGRDLLRGLGIATQNRLAAALIKDALHAWTQAQPPLDQDAPPLAVTIPTAFDVVQNYGQLLPGALEGDDRRKAAETAKWMWDHTVGLGVQFINRPVIGIPVKVTAGYVAIWAGMDGTWENDVERGLNFSRDRAIDVAVSTMTPVGTDEILRVVAQARESYDGTEQVVGRPAAPVSPKSDNWGPVKAVGLDLIGERRHR